MFEKILKRSSWTDIIISLIFAVIGILLATKPTDTINAISIVLGVVFIVIGVLKLIEYYTTEIKSDYFLTVALLGVVFGTISLFSPGTIHGIFKTVLGLWVIATGIMDLQIVLRWKAIKSPYWTASLIFSILMMFAGMIIILKTSLVEQTIGIIIVVYALLDIIDRIIFIKKIDDFLKEED